ncbi:MAG: dethiobiotin synthase [Bacteroidetes bacterium]|nr:dethiobiotin synthase [Bacteroidota bacterium]
MQPIFITGIGTDVGKTLAAAIITEALQADYWKPIQAGFSDGTDAGCIKERLSNPFSKIHPETYKLKLPASPHIAAREEGVKIELDIIAEEFDEIRKKKQKIRNEEVQASDIGHQSSNILIIEGAGGLLVPLNEKEFVIDLIKKIDAKVILVSRNYLGSINHSLLTAEVCKANKLDVMGWIFNDQYLHYENEIESWSGYPKIASIPFSEIPDKQFVYEQAQLIKPSLLKYLDQ